MIRSRTKSAEETQLLAASVAEVLRSRDLVLLVGEIGAGKTTFVQGLGRGLGIDEQITSPTFVLMRSYAAQLPLHHIDIYRLDHLQEVIDLGLMELLDDGGVALMEWGDLAIPVLPSDYLEIRIAVEDESSRTITFRGMGSMWSSRERALNDCISNWVFISSEDEQ